MWWSRCSIHVQCNVWSSTQELGKSQKINAVSAVWGCLTVRGGYGEDKTTTARALQMVDATVAAYGPHSGRMGQKHGRTISIVLLQGIMLVMVVMLMHYIILTQPIAVNSPDHVGEGLTELGKVPCLSQEASHALAIGQLVLCSCFKVTSTFSSGRRRRSKEDGVRNMMCWSTSIHLHTIASPSLSCLWRGIIPCHSFVSFLYGLRTFGVSRTDDRGAPHAAPQ